MTIGIIGAMDEEVALLKETMANKKEVVVAGYEITEGTLSDKQVVLLKSGIGKVNAALATAMLIERYAPEAIINTGSAGGFATNLEVGDIVISDSVVHHDVDVTAFDYVYGQVPQMPPAFQADQELVQLAKSVIDKFPDTNAEIGLIATGDSFMSDPERVAFVRDKFPAMLAAEMEAAAVAQVAYHYGTPFVIVRALSDIAGKESSVSFDAFLDQAARNAATLIMKMVEHH
ncbi:5'-methylthioadenosine/S-adenosylhomocysteine nucleosidase [Terribacillus saccharophilus]|uniref:5'-methylthioadenosine/S-adenosylhomocysteine nucleosidase n=1 Tax=Terribacillus saccharophilus TaxID=361277 RepID=UPI000BA6FF0F|nr:5'-methylthioadenosine/S-adenosylhomocysteine nucleosidase [Terribacillus saccharophilus]PAF40958.1 5'-methylthioadenosine/S-adenosylhomocysteine nucleosidase [Terribacillus saccharophilus]